MPIIEVENLVKCYKRTQEPSVRGVSFSVEEGEFFAFLGPNGAGKTTTISILTTTLAKTSGDVLVAGHDVGRQAKQVREEIGIIFQKPSLDPNLTAEQNIRLHASLYGICSYRPSYKSMPRFYREKVEELAGIVGVEEVLFKPVKKLSGGMVRKVEVVRSLIHTPRVLFLDEPTQGMDAVSRRELWDYIDKVRHQYGTTIFLTTHYIDEAERTDRVCIINHGHIVSNASPEEMKDSLMCKRLILDAEDRDALISELRGAGFSYHVDRHVTVAYQGATAQEIIMQLHTPLTMLKIHEPTLEDAYIAFLGDTEGAAA